MDNVTHTLVGIALARAAKPKTERSARAAFWAAVVASNLPDLDFVMPQAMRDGKIGYLLHHRGHTHTLWAITLLGISVAAIASQLSKTEPSERPRIFLVGWFACLLHVVADSWNSYGVHPFSPFSNRWFYGDFIFILEPLLWCALIPLAIGTVKWRVSKGAWALIGIALLAVVWTGSYAPMPIPLVVTAAAALGIGLQRRWPGPRSAWTGAIAVLLSFAFGSWFARTEIRGFLSRSAPTERSLDLAITPAPANPACWQLVSMSVDADGFYRARVGAFSIFPKVMQPAVCALIASAAERRPPLVEVALPTDPRFAWEGEFRAPAAELASLAAAHCGIAGFVQFARAPYWSHTAKGLFFGDLRFSPSKSRGGFSQLTAPELDLCPSAPVPPWLPPRTDLLEIWKR